MPASRTGSQLRPWPWVPPDEKWRPRSAVSASVVGSPSVGREVEAAGPAMRGFGPVVRHSAAAAPPSTIVPVADLLVPGWSGRSKILAGALWEPL